MRQWNTSKINSGTSVFWSGWSCSFCWLWVQIRVTARKRARISGCVVARACWCASQHISSYHHFPENRKFQGAKAPTLPYPTSTPQEIRSGVQQNSSLDPRGAFPPQSPGGVASAAHDEAWQVLHFLSFPVSHPLHHRHSLNSHPRQVFCPWILMYPET